MSIDELELSEEDVAIKRLRVLQLAEILGSVSEACRRSNMDRTSFYEWRRRYQQFGLQGLRDLPPVHKSHPQTTPKEVREEILKISLENPTWGCVRISDYLKERNIKVSSPTVQKILIRNGMGKVKDRVIMLEKESMKGTKLSEKQIKLIEKVNTCFKERHILLERPGQLLIQDTISIGNVKGLGKVYMQTVIDPYSSYVFALLHTKKQCKDAIRIFHQEVLPFYKSKSLDISSVLTDQGPEFTGKNDHPFEMYLGLNNIKHEKGSKSLNKNGFVTHFKSIVKDEFLNRASEVHSLEELQTEFNAWMHHYNNERAHFGFPTMGKTPFSVIHNFQQAS